MQEFTITPDRYDGRPALAYLVAANVQSKRGALLIEVPLGDDTAFEVYFNTGAAGVDAVLLAAARTLLEDIGRLDNEVQATCAAAWRTSEEHWSNFKGELTDITVARDQARLHYVGTYVNTEWEELVMLQDGRWVYP